MLREISAGGQNLRNIVLRQSHEIIRQDPYMLELVPSPPPPQNVNEFVPWLRDALHKIPIFTSVADLYGTRTVPVSREEVCHPDEREAKRVKLWESIIQFADEVLDEVPEAMFLLPDPHDTSLSKRAWERALYIGRACLRALAAGDRREGHNFAPREYKAVLCRHPALRDLLPDPADDVISDGEWMKLYTHGMHMLMRS